MPHIFDFAKNNKSVLYQWSDHLLNWQTYNPSKKRSVYDEESCHELDTYIRFKDRPFFDEIVRPFISNKARKTIVDLCLL